MADSLTALDRFRDIVLADAALLQELRGCTDRSRFMALVLARGRARGCLIEKSEVDASLNAATRAWTTRWLGT